MRIGDFGQPRAEAQLERLLERERAGGTFLFAGPPGSGKEALAVELGRLVNCELDPPCPARAPFTRAGTKASRARCNSCHKFDNLQHPDLLLVFPVPADTWDEHLGVSKDNRRTDTMGKILEAKARNPYFKPDDFERPASIQADVLREKVIGAAYNRPVEARVKVIVLSEIERTAQDKNTLLLKTLEEPPANCLFVLATAVPQRLPATIVSRCQRVPFTALDPEWMEPRLVALEETTSREARFAIGMSQGSMLSAARFLGKEQRAVRDRVFEVLDFAISGRELELLETAQALAQGHAKARHVVPSVLQMMAAAARDALMLDAGVAGRAAGQGAVALVNTDRATEIAAAARALGVAGARTVMRGAAVAERDIAGNAAVEHTLAAFFLDVARAAAANVAAAPSRRA